MPLVAMGQVVECPVTADTWISFAALDTAHPRQSDSIKNFGSDSALPISGRESLALLRFDVAALKGRTVEKAVLRFHRANADPVPLHTIGLSTISGTDWAENEATFYVARAGRPWSYAGSELIDVIFGPGGSLFSYERVRDVGDGWYEADVPAQVIEALVSGDQYGLALTDEKGQTHTLHRIDSRESPHPPRLLVTPGGAGFQPAGRVSTRPLGQPERPGTVALSFGGAHAAHYDLRYSAQPISAANFDQATPVPRWMLNPLAPKGAPLAISNQRQDWVTAVVESLAPGASYHFAVRPVDAAGNAGPVSPLGVHRAHAPQGTRSLAVAPRTWNSAQEHVPVWAVPELLKIHPRTGELLEHDYPSHRLQNAVWEASTATVRLRGARNEFLGFQLAIESREPVSGIEVQVSRPLFAGNRLPPVFAQSGAIQLAREWFVPDGKGEWYADGLAPLTPLSIPAADNAVTGQTVAPLFVDVYVPHDVAPGIHSGELHVHGAGLDRKIRIEVEVLPLTLPDRLGFLVDLNGYSSVPLPAGIRLGTPKYRNLLHAWHRVAHLHRTNMDLLGYSQRGYTLPDQAPPLEGRGSATRVTSWQDWDAHFGPILSGTAFRDLPRSGVPVPEIYLPFFENWPGNLRESYPFEHPEKIETVEQYQDLLTRHALKVPPIEQAFSREYQERFTAVVSEFARHIRERGWLSTEYLLYLNNKYYFKRPVQGGVGSALWLLDEPNHRDDVRALSFFYDLTKRGLAGFPGVPIRTRADISRVEWIRDTLAGQIDINCVSGRFYEKNRYLRSDPVRFGNRFWNYASTNHPRETNVAMRAWCWRAWTHGADGVVPWLAVAGEHAWERAEPLTVFYPGEKFGRLEPFPSLRLKAFRRGQQDVEYLILLSQRPGWDREAVSQAVAKALDLGGTVTQADDEDAGSLSFQSLEDRQLEQLRLRVAEAISHTNH